MRVLDIVEKPKETFIENADVLVVAGRGVKKPEDLKMLEKLADLLGGQLACTRPMVEAGWLDAKCQIGLSTVRSAQNSSSPAACPVRSSLLPA